MSMTFNERFMLADREMRRLGVKPSVPLTTGRDLSEPVTEPELWDGKFVLETPTRQPITQAELRRREQESRRDRKTEMVAFMILAAMRREFDEELFTRA